MTTLDEQALLLLLSPRQQREWRLHRHVTEISPSGRIYRIHPKHSAQVELFTPSRFFRMKRRALLCVLPDTYTSQTHTEVTYRWGRRHEETTVKSQMWTFSKVDIVAALIATIRGGNERYLVAEAVLISIQPWGIGLDAEEESWRHG